MRIASFDKRAIADTKRLVDVATLPPDTEIGQEWDAFLASFGRPGSQKRISALMELLPGESGKRVTVNKDNTTLHASDCQRPAAAFISPASSS